MILHHLLREDMIISELEFQEREAVLEEMVHFLEQKNKISREKELYDKLLQRERLGSTAIGEGVAIPHCKIKGIASPILLLGVSRKGVNFESVDGKPAHVFFLVVSSPDQPSQNLQVLAAISHLVRQSNSLIKKILHAKSPKSLVDVIREEEERLNE
jgi:fructose-specific phosphotransferase system IIA component